MRSREPDAPDGFLLDGKRYATKAEYQQALDARNERRQRWLEWIERERGAEGSL
jgi:hypothetical protein